MANYNDHVLARQQMPSLADLVTRLRAKRQAERAANPGDRPEDRMGGQQQVAIEGEAPIQAQPVRSQGQGRVGVEIGPVTMQQQQPMRLPGISVPIGGQRAAPAASAQPDPRNAMLKQYMAENRAKGMTDQQAFAEAFRKVQASG